MLVLNFNKISCLIKFTFADYLKKNRLNLSNELY